jgi:hypothetical protein
VIRAEILLLTSIHEDVMLESSIGDRREMAKCWIGETGGESAHGGAMGSESGGRFVLSFCNTLDRDLIQEIPCPSTLI